MTELKSPISKKPLGESKLNELFPDIFNWIITGTSRAITCEICGRKYPKVHPDDRCNYYAYFLGLRVGMDCCGIIFDELYVKHGRFIASLMLGELSRNPYLPDFQDFINELKEAGIEIFKKADQLHSSTSKILSDFNAQLAKV